MEELRAGGLVLYRRRPARVKDVDAGSGRIELETEDGSQRVRPKDVVLLHPGPATLADLRAPEPAEDLDAVRDLLSAEADGVDLATLAQWLYDGEATPAAVWAAWEIVAEGLHFDGTPERVHARTAAQVGAERERRRRVEAEAAAWEAFLGRLRAGACLPEDATWLRDVEGLAEGRREDARALKALGRAETPESAHALLLTLGWWTVARLPYAARAGVPVEAPAVHVGPGREQERLDLTHLPAFAIDDEGNRDPDDAVSVDDDGHLWVHVADVAWLVTPDSPADIEARARGATLYLPDGAVQMLPAEVVPRLGLGLAEDGTGPALSFRVEVGADGDIGAVDLFPSRVRVERLSYEAAEPRLATDDVLRRIDAIAGRARARRLAAGAVELDWPEVRIRVDAGAAEPVVDIHRLPPLRSRSLVAESMILAGAAAARWARGRGIAFPYSVQEAAPPEGEAEALPPGLPGAYALRRRQQPARVSGAPGAHRGLGLEAYGRATSPLRRYVDLLVHQQLRAAATGATPPWDETALMERAAQAEAAAGSVRAIERQANRHWTLVWLSQRTWEGRGILVDTRGRRGLLVCPQIALEAWVPVGDGPAAGAEFDVVVRSVDLPRLDLHVELSPVPA